MVQRVLVHQELVLQEQDQDSLVPVPMKQQSLLMVKVTCRTEEPSSSQASSRVRQRERKLAHTADVPIGLRKPQPPVSTPLLPSTPLHPPCTLLHPIPLSAPQKTSRFIRCSACGAEKQDSGTVQNYGLALFFGRVRNTNATEMRELQQNWRTTTQQS